MSANTHAPAYPWGEHGHRYGGLTKRELFAAMAMQAIMSDLGAMDRCGSNANVALAATMAADALIAELAK